MHVHISVPEINIFLYCHIAATVGVLEESYGINFTSRQDILVGAPIKLSIVNVMRKSSKVLVFLTRETLEDDLCQFEFDLLNGRDMCDIVVVSMIEITDKELNVLPLKMKDAILENRHFRFPLGFCSQNDSNLSCFIQTIADKLMIVPGPIENESSV